MKTAVKLTDHVKASGEFAGFKKFIWGRLFYFGAATPRREAERLALNLIHAADQLKTAGYTCWTDDAVEAALGRKADTSGVNIPTTKLTPVKVTEGAPARDFTSMNPKFDGWTITQGIDAYLTHLDAKQVSQHTRWWQQESMRQLKALLTGEADRQAADGSYNAVLLPSTKLAGIGFDELTWLVSRFRARPVSKKTGKPISVGTVRTLVGHLRDLFNYLADSGKWDECRRFERLFRINASSLQTNAEKRKQAAGVITFTTEELACLFAHANDQQKLYLLLGLNTASTQYDLATLTGFHVVNDGQAIARDRSKTGVKGFYQLWPTTAELLAKRMARTPANDNDNDLSLMTAEGKPLVWYKPNAKGQLRRVDSVLQTWNKLLKAKGVKGNVRPLPFKTLRKTGAQLLWDMTSDMRIVQCHLSHSSMTGSDHVQQPGEVTGKKTVAEGHYINARQFQPLTDALTKLWSTKLEPAIKLAEQQAAAERAARKQEQKAKRSK